MSELKPCPFCGESVFQLDEFQMSHMLNPACLLNCHTAYIDMWNTRPIEEKLRAENERLNKVIVEVDRRNKIILRP